MSYETNEEYKVMKMRTSAQWESRAINGNQNIHRKNWQLWHATLEENPLSVHERVYNVNWCACICVAWEIRRTHQECKCCQKFEHYLDNY